VTTDVPLLALMRGEFSSAKLFHSASVLLYIAAILLGVVATLYGLPLFIIISPFIMAILQGLSFVTDSFARVERSRAETVRRTIMLEDGLDWPVSPREEANMRAEASWFAINFARRADTSSYYASTKPKGPGRLLEHISESLFFTRHISRSASNLLLSVSFLVAVVGVAALVYAILAVSQRDVQIAIAKGAISVLLIAAASPPLRDALAFHRLAERCATLDEHIARIEIEEISTELVLKLLYTYDCSRFGAPLLPELIYRRKRAELNVLWQRRIAG
jgi:hypothetical protein